MQEVKSPPIYQERRLNMYPAMKKKMSADKKSIVIKKVLDKKKSATGR